MTLPNFLIIGAARAGTTALAHFLGQHPQVNMPYKEPSYFSGWTTRVIFDGPDLYPSLIKKHRLFYSREEYEALYADGAEKRVRVDASVSYLPDGHAAQYIRETIADVKILALLRQPVERAYSHFIMNIRDGWETETDFLRFIEDEPERIRKNWHPYWRYMELGRYPQQLVRYLDLFPPSQLKIKLYEDWNDHPQVFWDQLMDFLEIDNSFRPDLTQRINVSFIKTTQLGIVNNLKHLFKWIVPQRLRKSIHRRVEPMLWKIPRLDQALHYELTEKYFKKDILQLQDLLARDLGHWLC